MTNKDKLLFKKLKRFYLEVAELTVKHDVIRRYSAQKDAEGIDDPEETFAVVYPSKLSKVLTKINKTWYKGQKLYPFYLSSSLSD